MQPKNILVFRIGQLGDTIVALPAIWAARKHFPRARFTLLSDRHPGKPFVLAADLLRGAGLFDRFESYVVDNSPKGRLLKPLRLATLAWRLRQQRYDALVYLAPSNRSAAQIARDRRFFSKAGIRQFFGMGGFPELPKKISDRPLEGTPQEADLLLARMDADGISVPPADRGCFDLGLGEAEAKDVAAWLQTVPDDGGRTWLGVGPGSKMPAKRWPEERFGDVVSRLIEEFDIWPVVFGGAEDEPLAGRLMARWKRGHCAAGKLSLRAAAAALQRCVVYLGNDTGTMHLAAAGGIPCVGIFSAREWPGMWFPYGEGHRVLRSKIDCEGCGLTACLERKNECLNRITVPRVLAECHAVLAQNAKTLRS
jgi:heptosyltransferase III